MSDYEDESWRQFELKRMNRLRNNAIKEVMLMKFHHKATITTAVLGLFIGLGASTLIGVILVLLMFSLERLICFVC